METSIVQMGFNLMLYGMGMVFVFLSILVVCTSLMSKVIQSYFPEPQPEQLVSSTDVSTAVDTRTIEILQLAIDQHRKSRR